MYFIAAENDSLVHKHHAETLCFKFQGTKKFTYVPGDHNDPRPEDVLINIISFFKENLIR